uniref:Uncharacterized protein n=1 Tax=Anguilla anguilla TaxID=7936 RepID=A0A0E9RII6_ANGAN
MYSYLFIVHFNLLKSVACVVYSVDLLCASELVYDWFLVLPVFSRLTHILIYGYVTGLQSALL